jgi:hypothetical protein
VGIKCKKEGGWHRGFKPELTATAGETDCTGDDSDSVNLTITPLPDVRVEIDEPIDDVCSNDQDGFTFTATVYNDNAESNAKLGVTAVWGVAGQAGTACTANPNADGECCASWGGGVGGCFSKSVLRCSMVQPTPLAQPGAQVHTLIESPGTSFIHSINQSINQ